MTALLDVACHLPELSVDIREIGERAGIDERLIANFRRFYGLSQVRRAPGGDLREALVAAASGLTGLRGNERRVRHVIYARTISTVAAAHENPLEDVCAALGLSEASAFTLIEQGCATGLLAVELAGRLLAADGDPDALALVFSGEATFTPMIQLIPESTVLGECTAACLVGGGDDHDVLLGLAVHTYGKYAEDYPPKALDPAFLNDHNDLLAAVIQEAVEAAGAECADLTVILPHNVNRLSWVRTCRILGLPLDRVYLDNIPVTGHCFAADPFVNLVHAREAGRLRPGDLYLMASVGLGATFSAAVLRH